MKLNLGFAELTVWLVFNAVAKQIREALLKAGMSPGAGDYYKAPAIKKYRQLRPKASLKEAVDYVNAQINKLS